MTGWLPEFITLVIFQDAPFPIQSARTDAYWNNGGRPVAEKEFRDGSKAENGHVPTNDAGLDLTPAAMAALGAPGKINTRQVHVDWEFV